MAALLPVVLVRGDDPSLLSTAVRALIHEAAGDEDLSLGLDDFAADDYDLAAVVDAAQTPPMFTLRRVVVARELGRFSGDQLDALLGYLASPCPTTTLILVGGGGTIGRKVLDAVKKVGGLVEAGIPSGKARQQWFADRVSAGPVRLEPRAATRLAEHLATTSVGSTGYWTCSGRSTGRALGSLPTTSNRSSEPLDRARRGT